MKALSHVSLKTSDAPALFAPSLISPAAIALGFISPMIKASFYDYDWVLG